VAAAITLKEMGFAMPIELLTALKMAGTAARFVEGGPLAEGLAALGLSAALTSMDKAATADDKRSQIWSAINHLESAQAALESKLLGPRGKTQAMLRGGNFLVLKMKRQYVLALMAICYRYLGEEDLAQQAIERGRYNPHHDLGLGVKVVGFINPLAMIEFTLYANDTAIKYQVDWDRFELPPRGLPMSGTGEWTS
jgi:hypothetical protein